MNTLRIPALRIAAIYWVITSLVGLLTAGSVFGVTGIAVGLSYTLFMLLLAGSSAFLVWASVQGRTPDDLFLALYGALNASAAVGFLVLRFLVFPDLYSSLATTNIQMNLLIVLFACTAIVSLAHNDAVNPKHLFTRAQEDPQDDPTHIDLERYERFNQIAR